MQHRETQGAMKTSPGRRSVKTVSQGLVQKISRVLKHLTAQHYLNYWKNEKNMIRSMILPTLLIHRNAQKVSDYKKKGLVREAFYHHRASLR